MKEEWRWIPEYEGRYEVSNLGRVRSYYTCRNTPRPEARILKSWTINTGYPVVGLAKPGRKSRFLVHRLVASAFIPNPLCHPDVNHKDSNRANPRVDNLEWVTRSENQKHAVRFGNLRPPSLRGEAAPSSVLKEAQVLEIRAIYIKGSRTTGQKPLARRYGVDQDTIANIVYRRTWTHI